MRLVIHAGQQKTASSSLQSQLMKLRPQLREQGVLYSEAFGRSKAKDLCDALWGRIKAGKDYDRSFQQLEEELGGDWQAVIISQENLYRLKPQHISKLHDILARPGLDLEIYVYVRRPDEHLSSFYQQKVHGFKDRSVDEFIDDCLAKDYYSYNQKFAQWEEVFGRGVMRARLFHRANIPCPPVEDFLKWAGLEYAGIAYPDEEEANAKTGLDPTLVEIARGLARFYFEHPDLVDEEFIFEFRRALRNHNTGGKVGISLEQATRLMNTVRVDNSAFAEKYLTGAEAGLFLSPAVATDGSGAPEALDFTRRVLRILNRLPGRAPPAVPAARPALIDDAPNRAVAGCIRACLAEFSESRIQPILDAIVQAISPASPERPTGQMAPDQDFAEFLGRILLLVLACGYDGGRSKFSATPPDTLVQREAKLQKKRRVLLRDPGSSAPAGGDGEPPGGLPAAEPAVPS